MPGRFNVGRAQWCVPSQSIEGCLEEQSALPLWSCGAVSVTAHRQTPARWRESRPNSLACLQGLESLAPFSCSTVVGSVAVVGLRSETAH
jgi:hypothetical protein